MRTVKLGYSSYANHGFKGQLDTGIEREEWDEMFPAEQDKLISEMIFELVDVWVEDE